MTATSTNEKQLQPYRDACQGHIKRKKLLRKIEAKIHSMEEVTVSLLSLYRGLLRDFDASSYKLLELQRTQDKETRKREKLEPAKVQRGMIEELKELRRMEANLPASVSAVEPKAPMMPLDNSSIRKLAVTSLLFIAMTMLAGCAQCLPRSLLVVQGVKPVVERLQADAQLVGGGGLVPLMLVQHRKDMLHLDILERTIVTGSNSTSPASRHRYRS